MIVKKADYIHYDAKKTYKCVFLDIINCPICGSKLKIRDSKRRKVIDGSGNTLIFSLPRLYCPKCQKLHTLMPDLIMPNKHYTRSVIELARTCLSDECAANDSTIRRWRK